nr:solute carrier family 17 member 9 isoform X5 [Vicugna pacos]
MQPPPDETRRDAAEDVQWSRPECQLWTGTLLLGTCLLYCARVSMPICAVSMSQDFGWNKKEAGLVLSSFFWGYCLTQVVGGHLGDRIGGEKVILLSASAWGFITAATPLLAHLGSAHLAFMTFSRILTGLLQGVYFPALTSLLSQKVRESERAFTYSTVGAGSQFGTLLTGAAGSLLLDWCGWQSVFYFSGGLTLLWVWYVYRCLLSEKDLLLALGVLAQGLRVTRHTKVPWRRLFWKSSVWAGSSTWCPGWWPFLLVCSAGFSLTVSSVRVTGPLPCGSSCSGISVNIQDLAPSCAGFLFGVANTAGALAGERWARAPCLQVSSPEFPGGPPGCPTSCPPTRSGCFSLAGCRGRVPGRLPHRDHGLLDVCVQPGGRHQQPGAVHLPGVREGPAGGPEPHP